VRSGMISHHAATDWAAMRLGLCRGGTHAAAALRVLRSGGVGPNRPQLRSPTMSWLTKFKQSALESGSHWHCNRGEPSWSLMITAVMCDHDRPRSVEQTGAGSCAGMNNPAGARQAEGWRKACRQAAKRVQRSRSAVLKAMHGALVGPDQWHWHNCRFATWSNAACRV